MENKSPLFKLAKSCYNQKQSDNTRGVVLLIREGP